MAYRDRKKWNVLRLGAFGFILGAVFTGPAILSYRNSVLGAHTPIATAIFGGLMGMIVFGGAAISRNRFVGSMAKFIE